MISPKPLAMLSKKLSGSKMTLNEFKAWLKEKMPENFRENEPMQAHTSFRIGGPADLLILPALRWCTLSVAG